MEYNNERDIYSPELSPDSIQIPLHIENEINELKNISIVSNYEEREKDFKNMKSNLDKKITNFKDPEKLKIIEELEKKLVKYPTAEMWKFMQTWKSQNINFKNIPEKDKSFFSDLRTYVRLTKKDTGNLSLNEMRDTFIELKNKHYEKEYVHENHVAVRNRNPGNLSGYVGPNGETYPKGTTGRATKFICFPTLQTGWEALLTSIDARKQGKNPNGEKSGNYTPDMPLSAFCKKYDPGNKRYIGELTRLLKVPATTPIKNIKTYNFAKSIANIEDGECYRALKDEGFIAS